MAVFQEYLENMLNIYCFGDRDTVFKALCQCSNKGRLDVGELLQISEQGIPLIYAIAEIELIHPNAVIECIRSGKIRYYYEDVVIALWHIGCKLKGM